MIRQTFDKDDIIFSQGDFSDNAYIIHAGSVSISLTTGDTEREIAKGIAGELIGEMALIDSEPRSATIRCLEKTTLIVVPKDVFDKLLVKTDPLIHAVLTTLLKHSRG